MLSQTVTLTLQRGSRTAGHQPPGQPVQRLRPLLKRALADSRDACGESAYSVQPIALIGYYDLGSGRGRCGSYVGHKVRDREIDFVPYGTDDRQRAIGNGASELLIVKRPQVFQRSAAAAQDQNVALVTVNSRLKRLNQFTRCSVTLDCRRVDNDGDGRKSTPENAQDVPDRRASG